MSSQLTRTSTPARSAPPASTPRRGGTIDLETQSAYKFGLAVVLGIAAIWVAMPVGGAGAFLITAVVIAARSLTFLAADPQARRSLRPREFATWDGGLAALLAFIAVVLMLDGAVLGAVVGGASAIVLAALRLRTRYVSAS